MQKEDLFIKILKSNKENKFDILNEEQKEEYRQWCIKRIKRTLANLEKGQTK